MAPASPEAKASAPESVRAVSMADAPATPAPVKKVTKPATSPEKKAVAPGAVKPVVAKKSDIKGKD